MTELLFLFGVAVLVALNGVFVAAEFSLVRASRARTKANSAATKKPLRATSTATPTRSRSSITW